MDTLPDDLILKIRNIVYSQNHQPKCLLDDISNFYETRNFILGHYCDTFSSLANLEWFRNDLRIIANGHMPISFGESKVYRSILNRNFKKIPNAKRINVRSEINIWWGLFTSDERTKITNRLRSHIHFWNQIINH